MSDKVPPSFWDNATIFFFLLLSGLLLLLNILRASSVKDSLTLVGFHFYMGLQKETSADFSPWTCPTCHPAEMQSLLISPPAPVHFRRRSCLVTAFPCIHPTFRPSRPSFHRGSAVTISL